MIMDMRCAVKSPPKKTCASKNISEKIVPKSSTRDNISRMRGDLPREFTPSHPPPPPLILKEIIREGGRFTVTVGLIKVPPYSQFVYQLNRKPHVIIEVLYCGQPRALAAQV